MRRIFAVLALLVCAPANAQVTVPQGSMEAVGAGMKSLMERLAPAKVDEGVVRTLMDRLIDGDLEFISIGRPDKDGVELHHRLTLVELPTPRGELGGPGSGFYDLVYGRTFSRLETCSERWTPRKDGGYDVDQWVYTVGLDGTLLKVEHHLSRMDRLEHGITRVHKDGNRSYLMSPRDSAVLRRWKRLEQIYLRMGRTIEV